jgi:hypothetical protein
LLAILGVGNIGIEGLGMFSNLTTPAELGGVVIILTPVLPFIVYGIEGEPKTCVILLEGDKDAVDVTVLITPHISGDVVSSRKILFITASVPSTVELLTEPVETTEPVTDPEPDHRETEPEPEPPEPFDQPL